MRALLGLPPKIPPTWRRKIIPACPCCGRAAAPANDMECRNWWAGYWGKADLYIDLATGLGHCIVCGDSSPVERWTHHCTSCHAVYEGGEVWQGMAAEAGRVGDLAWLRAAGIRRGVPEITFLGWSRCLACGKRFTRKTGLLRGGNAKGGICEPCRETAHMRMKPRLSLYRTWKPCSWCGQTKDRYRIVRIGRARLCFECQFAFWVAATYQ